VAHHTNTIARTQTRIVLLEKPQKIKCPLMSEASDLRGTLNSILGLGVTNMQLLWRLRTILRKITANFTDRTN